jgi:uncharacterized protein involved in outer membrane biogenesis
MPAEWPHAWIGSMSRSSRIVLFVSFGVVSLLVIIAATLRFLVDANVYRARLEATVSAALGMEVSFGGPLGVNLFPGLIVTLEDVHVHNHGVDVASAKQARLRIDFLPLLQQEIRIETIELTHPLISIERDRDGRFNFERPKAASEALPALDWPMVSLSDGTFVYLDRRFADRLEAKDCHLDVHRLQLAGGKRSGVMKDLSFTSELTCGEIRGDGFTVSELKFSAEAKNGVVDLKPVTVRVLGTQGSGSIHADFSDAVPLYHVSFSLSQFPIEEFFKRLTPRKVATGPMDFSAEVSMQGHTEKEMRQTLKGQVSLRGKNLALNGSDLDREFSRLESSQNLNLVDVGAFFFAGPLGLVVTRGFNLAGLLQGAGGSTEIRTLVSDWKVERGVAQARDVAMATKENRIALQGRLNFVNDQFDDVTVALIDAKGCAKVRQKIHGSFSDPVVEKPSVVEALAGPALRLLKKARDLFSGRECDVFYAGSVAAPK